MYIYPNFFFFRGSVSSELSMTLYPAMCFLSAHSRDFHWHSDSLCENSTTLAFTLVRATLSGWTCSIMSYDMLPSRSVLLTTLPLRLLISAGRPYRFYWVMLQGYFYLPSLQNRAGLVSALLPMCAARSASALWPGQAHLLTCWCTI